MKGRSPYDPLEFGLSLPMPPAQRRPSTAPPGQSRETAITITDLNNSARSLLEETFGGFWVRGEVCDFKRHRSGHWYFSLRDKTSQISCVIWSSDQHRIRLRLEEGMQVVARAQMTMYAAQGKVQLRLAQIEAEGDGAGRKALDELLARLRADGLLAAERKRPIPLFPRCVGVVTSASGAALRDIVSVASRRRPGIQIIVAPAAVQGDTAPREICRALKRLRSWKGVDVLIVGRGGGGREDLHAFNHEAVARAIAACEMPVISAVGHEIDTTICDLVADFRAATPSAAAEAAVPALSDLEAALRVRRSRLMSSVTHRTASAQADVKTTARDLRIAAIRLVKQRRATIGAVAGRLNALSPLAVLSRGYGVARGPDGETLTSVEQFVAGENFDLLLHDGVIGARVENTQNKKPS